MLLHSPHHKVQLRCLDAATALQPRRAANCWRHARRDVAGRAAKLTVRGSSDESREALYEMLGVAPGASAEAVKRAYRRLALRCALYRVDRSQTALRATPVIEPHATRDGSWRHPRVVMRRHHPDVSNEPDAPSKFQQIRRAYEGLLTGGAPPVRVTRPATPPSLC